MTSISNITFQLKRVKDVYTLVNLTGIDFEYTLIKEGCDTITIPIVRTVEANLSTALPITSDGFYSLEVNGETCYFNVLHNYRDRLVVLIQEALCKHCGCSPVNCLPKDAVDCLKNQSLFNFIQTYKYLVKPFSFEERQLYNVFLFNFYQKTIYNNRCFTVQELCKQLLDTSITGNSQTNKALFDYYIAIYYLGLYYYDVVNINTTLLTSEEVEEELIHLKEVYRYKKIVNCIRNLGVDINSLLEETLEVPSTTKVAYWQLTNTNDKLAEVLAGLTLPILDAKPFELYPIFNDGKTITYTNIGRIVFAIYTTVEQNFIITDTLGNNITDNFEVAYVPSLQCMVYVSKSIITHSTIGFEFNTLIL